MCKKVLNLDCWLGDHHDFIGDATKFYMPKQTPRIVQYRSFGKFNDQRYYHVAMILSPGIGAEGFTEQMLMHSAKYFIIT